MKPTYFETSLTFESHPQSLPEQTTVLTPYRVTVLTDQLFRIEYDPNGVFEDRPTQVFWHRNLKVPYTYQKEEYLDVFETAKWILTIDSTKEPKKGIALINKETDQVWTYDDKDKHNLGGTYRTLDQADGEVELEKGLISKDGITTFDDANSLTFEHGKITSQNKNEVDLYIFAYSKEYTTCIKDYYKISGKVPLIPKYVFGNWWSRYWNYTDEELEFLIRDFQDRNIPLSVCIIDMDWHITNVPMELRGGWTGYTWNKDYFKDPEGFMGWVKDQGLQISMNLHPADGIRPFDDCYNDVCKTMGIDPKSEQLIDFDLTNPLFVEAYFKDVHHPLEQQGVDFWWIDWQQGTTSKMENLDPLFALNHYHFYDKLNRGGAHNFIFSRWSGLGGHRYPIGFSGDTQITWESLDFQPYFTATATNVGFGWWSHDIGGHFHGRETAELYTRWVQFGVFSPVMRLHSTKSYYHKREPWRWNKETEETVTHYLQFRHQLIPYIHTFNHLHAQGQLPLIQPLYYQWPEDKEAYKATNQYFFGSELMVRPFTSKTIKKLLLSKEDVYFKEGQWFHFFSGEHIKEPGTYTIYGCTRDINVFAKAGAIIPLATNHEEGLENLPNELSVHLFPGDNNTFTLYEDEGNDVFQTTFQLTSTKNTMNVHISTNRKEPVEDRIIHLYFRSVDLECDVKTSTEHQVTEDEYYNTLIVSVPFNMVDDITVSLKAHDGIIDNPYCFEDEIMNVIDISELTTEQKNTIGFINFNNPHESRGWLAKENTLQEKLDEIDHLNLPRYVKKYLYHTTLRALKNGE